MKDVFIGVDLGGTETKIGCFDSDLNRIARTTIPTYVELGSEAIVDRIGRAVEELLSANGIHEDEFIGAGIGSPGVIDVDAGVVIATSNLRFENVPLRQMLQDRLGKPVVLENDANITCWAEHVSGAGKGCNEMILITLGTGIGGGLITNGELVHGSDCNAAELGHTIYQPDGRQCGCGQKGCIEAYASANSTAARATEAIQAGAESSLKKLIEDNGEITCKDVYEHSAAGDKLAREITDGSAKALAQFCISILHVSGPECIVFYGGMTHAGSLLLDPIKKYFRQGIWTIKKEHVKICLAMLGDNAGIVGSAALALHHYKKGKKI
jgi:glucokinase